MAKKPTSGPSTTKPLYEGTAEAHKHDGGPAFPRAGLKLAGGVDPSQMACPFETGSRGWR